MKKLLVGSAHYILESFGKDSDLRRHGEKLASRGGKNAKKRAVVAVARKLAELPTCLLIEVRIHPILRSSVLRVLHFLGHDGSFQKPPSS